MTENCLTERPGDGRTFKIAMAVIGGIASFQILVLGFGVLRRAPAEDKLVVSAPLDAVEVMADTVPAHPLAAREQAGGVAAHAGATDQVGSESSPVVPNSQAELPRTPTAGQTSPRVDVTDALRPAGSVARDETARIAAPPRPELGALASEGSSLSAALVVAGRENVLSDEPILERLMSTGAELRASGNMQGALQAFRQVETALPLHPRIQAELAATLGQMGLTEKAKSYWERIEEAGPTVAGAYFSLAGQQLRGEAPPSPDATAPVMKIGEVMVQEQAPTSDGQTVALRVIVDADPNARPVGDDLTLLVYFYDQVTGGEVKASTADTSYEYPSAPYDWQGDGTEEIVVKYHQPVFTQEQKREFGDRTYYGYAIELYYRDQIQDKVVMPAEIDRLRAESPAEPAPAGGFLGPENALFPESIHP